MTKVKSRCCLNIHVVGVKFLESVKVHSGGVKVHIISVKTIYKGMKVDLESEKFLESVNFSESTKVPL